MPDCIASTVLRPITDRGRASSTRRSWAPRAPSASTETSMPGAMAPPRYSPFAETASNVVAVPKSTTMHGPAEQLDGGQRVDDAVGADLLGVVGEHRHAGLHARLDHDRGHVAVVAPAHVAHLLQHRRHRRADRDAVDLGAAGHRVLVEQTLQDHGDLVGRPGRLRPDPPVLDEVVALEQAEHGVGVADVDGEQHHAPPSLTLTLSMSRVVPTRAATASSASPVKSSGTSCRVAGSTRTR